MAQLPLGYSHTRHQAPRRSTGTQGGAQEAESCSPRSLTMATSKQEQVVFDEATAAALKVIFKQALQESLPEILERLRDWAVKEGGLKP